MKILIVTPARVRSRLGNAITAQRYASFFRKAGWKATLARTYRGEDVDVLVALHAYKSADAALCFRTAHPHRPLIVVLTGTDLYGDLLKSIRAQRVLAAATAVVTLQPLGLQEISAPFRIKARSIIQSSPLARLVDKRGPKKQATVFCVLGHLRAEKDPLRAAMAVRLLPRSVNAKVLQAGGALDRALAQAARREIRRNPRYRWLGELSRGAVRRLLRSSDAMIISSILEGGANVVSEAIANGVPVLASRIEGNVGLLGDGYPGLYPVRDTKALARLMLRVVDEAQFLRRLRTWIRRLRPLVSPASEKREWMKLVHALATAPTT